MFQMKRALDRQRAPDWPVTLNNKLNLSYCVAASFCDVDADDLLRKMAAAASAVPVEEITDLQVLGYIYSNILDELYPSVNFASRQIVTVPVTVATIERSFSHWKLNKTHLRTTMQPGASVSSCSVFYWARSNKVTGQRWNHLSVLSIPA